MKSNYIKTAYVLTLFFLIGIYSATAGADGFSITKDEDIMYGQGIVHSDANLNNPQVADLMIDLWYPKEDTRSDKPCLVYIHGGGFGGSLRRNIRKHPKFYPLAEAFVPKGYVVLSIEYRLHADYPLAPIGPYAPLDREIFNRHKLSLNDVHAAVRDTKAAIRWIRAVGCNKYGIDPNRICLVGTSAGACTALGAAINQGDFLSDGPNDFTVAHNHPGVNAKPNACFALAGRDHCVSSADFIANDPNRLPWHLRPSDYDQNDPPIALWHGTEDKLISVQFAHKIKERCDRNNIPCEKYIIEGGGHVCFDDKYEGKDLFYWIEQFAQKHLNLSKRQKIKKSDNSDLSQ